MNTETDSTAVICTKCGAIVAVCVTEYIDASFRSEIGQLAADGYDIKHMTTDAVRKSLFGCQCAPRQEVLL